MKKLITVLMFVVVTTTIVKAENPAYLGEASKLLPGWTVYKTAEPTVFVLVDTNGVVWQLMPYVGAPVQPTEAGTNYNVTTTTNTTTYNTTVHNQRQPVVVNPRVNYQQHTNTVYNEYNQVVKQPTYYENTNRYYSR